MGCSAKSVRLVHGKRLMKTLNEYSNWLMCVKNGLPDAAQNRRPFALKKKFFIIVIGFRSCLDELAVDNTTKLLLQTQSSCNKIGVS